MARGKYSSAAAKRRAESAEQQLDRLLPQLVDMKRQAGRYESEAAAAPLLRAEIARLRESEGISPKAHRAALHEQETRHVAEMERVVAAFDIVVGQFANLFRDEVTREGKWISPQFLRALRDLPGNRGDRILRRCGMDRDEARTFLSDGAAANCTSSNMHRAHIAAIASFQAGAPHGTVYPHLMPDERLESADDWSPYEEDNADVS